MKTFSRLTAQALLLFLPLLVVCGQETPARTPVELFSSAVQRIVTLVEPPEGERARTFSSRLEIVKAEGLPDGVAGQSAMLGYQAPDRMILSVDYKGENYSAGRNHEQVWIHVSGKKFGVIGEPGLPRFATAPEKKDPTRLGPLRMPLPKELLDLLPLLMNVDALAAEKIGDTPCHVLNATAKPEAIEALKIPGGTIKLWIRKTDSFPIRIGYSDGKKLNVEVQFRNVEFSDPWPAKKWEIPARDGDKIETTALGHLTRFVSVAISSLGENIPSLGEATGERRTVATEGKGRFEMIDGTRVLHLEGTPEEMGIQHGVLLKKEIKQLVNRIVYGVGVGSSFAKGRWFFGEIEEAQNRLNPEWRLDKGQDFRGLFFR